MKIKKLEEKIVEIIIPVTVYLSYFFGKFSRRLKLERFSSERKQEIFLVEQKQGRFSTGQKQVFVIFLGVLSVFGIFVYGGGLDKTDYYFKCPNTFKSEKEYTDSLYIWLLHYMKEHPKVTEDEIMEARKVLMKENNCEVGKFSMVKISDDFQLKTASLYKKDFFLDSVDFMDETKVWIASFLPSLDEIDGQEIYINFYLQGIWKSGKISAEDIYQTYLEKPKNNLLVELLAKPFVIEKSSQKEASYFIIQYEDYPEENYGYLYIIKTSSIGNSAYSIIYARKIEGKTNEEAKSNAKAWLSKNLKIDTGSYAYEQLDSIKIDEDILKYLISKSK